MIEASTEQIEPPRRRPRAPRVAVPAGACDAHAHVFAPAGVYPYADKRPYTPAPGTDLAAYRRMLQALGIERAVLVHSNIYGPDNRATTDALAAMTGAFRGVALVRPEIDDGNLEALAAAGMRGIRINLEFPGEMGLAEVETMAPRLADLGWHVQMLVQAERLPEIAARLRALPIDVVIDHMGLPTPERGLETGGLRAMLALLESGRCWVKLSAPYYAGSGAPAHAFAAAVAGRLLAARPDRMLFGSNWPHPHSSPPPDEGDLVDWLASVTRDAGLRQVLVDNPATLYGFASP
jgi:predicted TIM-barrel fold metal-dependent hydrolase